MLSVKSVVYKKFTDNLLSKKQLAVKFLHFFRFFSFIFAIFITFATVMDKDIRKKYQRYLRLERGLSENTLEAYMLDLDKLLTFLHDKGVAPESASLHDLEDFCGALFDLGISTRSQARILSGVRSFYRFLELDGYIDNDPSELLESPTQDKHLPEVLSLKEVDMLEASIDLSKWEGQRNKAIIEVLFSCTLTSNM